MLAFLVEIEGHPSFVAGVDDWSVLGLHVSALRGEANNPQGLEPHIDFSIGGLSRAGSDGVSYHFRWPRVDLELGATVKVTLVESDSPDPPAKRYRSDREVQESPYTEEEFREMRYQNYLELKKEFESDENA